MFKVLITINGCPAIPAVPAQAQSASESFPPGPVSLPGSWTPGLGEQPLTLTSTSWQLTSLLAFPRVWVWPGVTGLQCPLLPANFYVCMLYVSYSCWTSFRPSWPLWRLVNTWVPLQTADLIYRPWWPSATHYYPCETLWSLRGTTTLGGGPIDNPL